MKDLRAIGVDVVTFGQYLQPTKGHMKVRARVCMVECVHVCMCACVRVCACV
jgi:lipoate synthase